MHTFISNLNISMTSSKNKDMLCWSIFYHIWTWSPRQSKAGGPRTRTLKISFSLCGKVDDLPKSGLGIHIYTCWHWLPMTTNPLHFLWIGGKAWAAVSSAVAPRGAEGHCDRLDRHAECLPNTFVYTSRQPGEITKWHRSCSLWHQQAPPPSFYYSQQRLTSCQRAGLY